MLQIGWKSKPNGASEYKKKNYHEKDKLPSL